MQVTSISVKASRTLPHPNYSYANYKTELELHATLNDGDDADSCAMALQCKAESLVEQHAAELRKSIGEFHRVVTARERLPQLEHKIDELQAELDRTRADADLPLFHRSSGSGE